MSLQHIGFAVWLAASSAVILPAAAFGQAATLTDTAASARDSTPDSSDTAAATSSTPLPADSLRDSVITPPGDSVSVNDTTSSPVDSLAGRQTGQGDMGSARSRAGGPGVADSTRPTEAAAPTAPVDSILSAACQGSEGAANVAPDLLVVVFAPEAGRTERDAVARSEKGKLLGPVSSTEPGAYYLRVPTRGEEHRLRAVADKLIRSGLVRQVGSRTCPSVPPADSARSSSLSSGSLMPSVSVPPQ
jgi:hypothetical protein